MKAAALPADSGQRSVEEVGLLADLPARIAEMEGEIRGLRDTNRSRFLSLRTHTSYYVALPVFCPH